jgi:hypothetical protein
MEGAAVVVNVFRQTEKRFQGKHHQQQQQPKRRRRKEKSAAGEGEPNLPWEEVIDFSNLEANSPANRSLIVGVAPPPHLSAAHPGASDSHVSTCTAAAPPQVTKIFSLADTPGTIFIYFMPLFYFIRNSHFY